MSHPNRPFTPAEITEEIKNLNPRKSLNHDLINGKISKHLPKKVLVSLVNLYDCILLLCNMQICTQYNDAQARKSDQ